MQYKFNFAIFCFFCFAATMAHGQGTGNSPFSQFGIGDLVTSGNVRNMGMGSTGVSNRNHYFINVSNPALLANNRTRKNPRANHTYKYHDYYRNQFIDSTVKIDFTLNYQHRNIQAASGKESSGGANVSYFAFAIPMSKTWATAIGIQPFSTVSYDLTITTPVINNPTVQSVNTASGRGGIYKMFFSNGVGITSNLSLGLESSFLFGNINNNYNATIDSLSTKIYGFKRQNTYSALNFKPGIHFRKEIITTYHDTIKTKDSLGNVTGFELKRKTKSSGAFYNIGLTYDLFTNLNIHRDLHLYVMDNANRITTDTSINKSSFKAKLPPTVRLGFSLDVPFRWSAAVDVFYSSWSVYHPAIPNYSDTLKNSYGISVGGEFAPGQLKLRSRTYRVGFSYLKTPIVYHGYQLDDVSASIGGTIPFGRRHSTTPVLPRINVAIVAGKRGNIQHFGLNEQYIKVNLGILINEKWFNKRKIY